MADGTPIEWAVHPATGKGATWNPITGCSHASPGCKNCYAQAVAGSRLRHHPSRAGLTVPSKNGPVWNGQVRFNEEWLLQPFDWKKPRGIFVCAHGDLFHEDVPDAWIDRVFTVMALNPHHIFFVLTKRAERMRDYIRARSEKLAAKPASKGFTSLTWTVNGKARYHSRTRTAKVIDPLPNVWLGVSVEDQQRADERIPLLLDTPAALRWISAEPLLGPIDLEAVRQTVSPGYFGDCLRWHHQPRCDKDAVQYPTINWVVVGGESGRKARPMHPDWARTIRDQCAAAGVPFFFKQWGEWATAEQCTGSDCIEIMRAQRAYQNGDLTRAHVFADHVNVARIGKKAAGNLLDGRTHLAIPEIRT